MDIQFSRRVTPAATGHAFRDSVFLVDPDDSVRDTLESHLRGAGWQVESFALLEEFLVYPRATGAGCLLLDVSPSLIDGLAFQEVVAQRKTTPLVFVSGHCDIPMTVRAMKTGAVDFLTKPIHVAAMLHAVQCAMDRSRAALNHESSLRVLRERYAKLSPRERQVLERVVSGLLNKQIGFELGISEITVKAHRGRLMRKMAADSLADLVHMAARLA